MVEFLTLFLGLVSGFQTIEVSVTEDIAAVELMLDGEVVAKIASARRSSSRSAWQML